MIDTALLNKYRYTKSHALSVSLTHSKIISRMASLGHSNWIISFPLMDVTTSMRAGGLLLLSYYLSDITYFNLQ